MNRKVYLIAALLIVLAGALINFKVLRGGQSLSPEVTRHLWRVKIIANITGKGEHARVRLTLPKNNAHQKIYNEHFENDEMVFYVRTQVKSGNRIGTWRAEILDGSKSLQYTFSAQLRRIQYEIPENLTLPENPEKAYPPEMKQWLDPSKFIQSKDLLIQDHLKAIIGHDKNVAQDIRKIFNFVHGDIRYQTEKKSKDAKETLLNLEANCGGKARLFAALAQAAGIPTRLVGGMIMTPSIKTITHVWVESYIGGKWIPFDVVNNYFAYMPNHYVELYRGDYPLFKHVGLLKFDYYFVITKERIPPLDNPWSLYVLPIHFQKMIKVLLLIPLGAVIVALFRTIVGIPTFGTFAPVLLALAFREVSLGVGLLFLAMVVAIGCAFRNLLDWLKILVIPRLSIVVTLVIMVVLASLVLFYQIGQQRVLYVTLFPMIIITWTIERFSVLQIEDGTRAAIQSAVGTAIVATAAYFVMGIRTVRIYLFAFPELLLVIMAVLLILGRYTGIRFSELYRFREFYNISGRKKL
ncbi:MAG: UUP1 family membrane protein [Candidatus Omnitrophica bacterium]|nr:UUP1 family membrane protein [Candidatus Omnitrophota bacterium]